MHTAQLMPLPLTVSCFIKIQIGFTFLVPAHPGSPGQRAAKRVCVCVLYKCTVTTATTTLLAGDDGEGSGARDPATDRTAQDRAEEDQVDPRGRTTGVGREGESEICTSD